jgi:integrase
MSLRTNGELRWLLTEGKSSLSLKAATLLYLHGVRITVATKLKVKDLDFGTNPAKLTLDESRTVHLTDELSHVLRGLTRGKREEDANLGYVSFSEFHNAFRRAVRASKLRFDLADIKGMFRSVAGSNYALLKQCESVQPFTPDDVRGAWLKVLLPLVVGL